MQLTDGRTFWGDCPLGSQADGAKIQKMVERLVASHLTGESVTDFYRICEQLSAIEEPYQYEEIVPDGERPAVSDKNRRRLWQAMSGQDMSAPTRVVQSTRPLPRDLRYAVSLALLQASAAVNDSPLSVYLTQQTAAPLPQIITRAEDVAHAPLFMQVGGVRYTIQSSDPALQLGAQAEKLQGFMRQLALWISRMGTAGQTDHAPVLYLEANGALGKLYERNLGKILGAILGLEGAVKPYQLYIVDPLDYDTAEDQLTQTAELRDYLRFRQLKTQIVASAGVESADDVLTWVAKKGAHVLCLRPRIFGEMSQLFRAAELCHAAEMPFVLSSSPRITSHNLELLTAVSQTLRPAFFRVPPSMNLFLQVDRWRKQNDYLRSV